MKNRYPADVLTKARVACDQIAGLEEREGNPDTLGRLLAAHDDINEGEALFLAVAAEKSHYAILTGDRRALVAFGQASGIDDIRAALTGRVVCLEVVLHLLADRLGVAELSARLDAMIPMHQTLKVLFSPACQVDHNQCYDAIDSYFGTLKVEVGVTLLFNPFGSSHGDAVEESAGPPARP